MGIVKKAWHTEDSNVFLIGGRKVAILKRGREQARQIEKLNKWMKLHLAPLTENLKGQDANDPATGWTMFASMMDGLTEDAQIELANLLVGDKDADGHALPVTFIDEHYDINWVVDALGAAGQGSAMQRLMTSFFSNVG